MLSQNRLRLRLALRLAAAVTLAALFTHPVLAATTEELEAKLQALASQVQALQSEVAALKAQNGTANSAPRAAQAAGTTGSTSSLNTLSDAAAPGAVTTEKRVDLFGYGEITYARPTDDSSGTTADVGRFVLGTAYRFDDRTRFVSELEVEHAVSSADDAGEVEVEQAWIERQVSSSTYAKLGLFLIPSGMLNESHEPTRYYGVFRNFVETAIIPSTWRELGVAFEGNTSSGLRWDVGLTTGNDLSKWDAGSSEGIESPLGAIHQEGQLARAGDLSGFLAANYT
jgi:outer membrane murein-binding lipoprotein Lpp